MKLIEDLKKGPGSKKLSRRVLRQLGWKRIGPAGYHHNVYNWKNPAGEKFFEAWLPDCTEMIDQAATLIPPQKGSNKAGFLSAAFHQRHIGDIPDDALARYICIALILMQEKEHDQ